MKRAKLESYLQQVESFNEPQIKLEQYVTPASITASLIHDIQMKYNDIGGCSVLDMGCGTGMLSCASLLMGANLVISLDIDPAALSICKSNIEAIMESANSSAMHDFLFCDATSNRLRTKVVDTVVMNPPFGTKGNKGTDVKFLDVALSVASKSVYSFHKTATRKFLLRKANQWNVDAEVIAELIFDLPQTYKKHKAFSIDVQVDVIRYSFR